MAADPADQIRAALAKPSHPCDIPNCAHPWSCDHPRMAALAALDGLEARLAGLEAERVVDQREIGSLVKEADGYKTRLAETQKALSDNERDARWIVGQWQRLKDEPVKAVALEIVQRCAALTTHHTGMSQRGDASGRADDRTWTSVSSVATDAPRCTCKHGASGSHSENCAALTTHPDPNHTT